MMWPWTGHDFGQTSWTTW